MGIKSQIKLCFTTLSLFMGPVSRCIAKMMGDTLHSTYADNYVVALLFLKDTVCWQIQQYLKCFLYSKWIFTIAFSLSWVCAKKWRFFCPPIACRMAHSVEITGFQLFSFERNFHQILTAPWYRPDVQWFNLTFFNCSESGSRVPQLPFNWQLLPAS